MPAVPPPCARAPPAVSVPCLDRQARQGFPGMSALSGSPLAALPAEGPTPPPTERCRSRPPPLTCTCLEPDHGSEQANTAAATPDAALRAGRKGPSASCLTKSMHPAFARRASAHRTHSSAILYANTR
ncbi:hypothetical protein NDU88_002688 [Pleurodeles waltl]|uniref:Uncharacterized protein n=1 Tax=Pleurodeles waltl TaxID=8319 RepID=A0AAV7VFP6_PLEWA|nr:hypothetical protein NDU88_002688 [Pleurodeles waltl]